MVTHRQDTEIDVVVVERQPFLITDGLELADVYT